MFTSGKTVLAAVALTAGTLTVTAAPAHAAGRYYSSCSALHHDFKHGVARSYTAAMRQVRAGYGRPAYGDRAKAIYWRNYTRLDRDRDGTACEA
ncbi:excalibur calcium-binding domain-containing protein [Nocardioides marmoribigeumensis]|uniref:Excalibur calcium-binding domain-containing protein n=1 Tax=Nocardioides marmoribigeumensis TaxID=433649 RepID=A0ABU2C0I5_9ACTN|nr:excalibur calcium-binding domain-containing protein [Nocardioides marmoribigeumensis]MDR7364166.1 hypothetical protein [Nocardioides marmoribigeumensis]